MKTIIRFMGLTIASIFLVACASAPPLTAKQQSGFLSDYSSLKPFKTQSDAKVWRWISPEITQGQFSKLQIEPLVFYPEPVTTDLLSMNALNELGKDLTDTARESARTHQIPVVEAPDGKTLTLRAALTTVELKDKKFRLRELIPIHLIWSVGELAMGKRDKDVTVILEYEFIDTQTGETLVRGVRQDEGIPVVNNKTPFTIENAKPVLKDLVKDLDTEFKRLKQALSPTPERS